ncbi:MAG: hypothetical protein HQL72_03575 [Magnetococcales bacterium]|nr:hypothetical protein [Magnetococcales bacterium]
MAYLSSLQTAYRTILGGVFLAVLAPAIGSGGEPTSRPLLRIEGQMHTEAIRRIATDRANRLMVSVSSDKTLRLWKLPSGKLWKTFRVPLAAGQEGKLQAVAVSAGGGVIAVSGHTGRSWERKKGYFIYFFDTLTGKMKRVIGGLPSTARHLAFSKDSRYLAVALSEKGGVRVYQVRDGRLLRQDDRYEKDTTWVDFDHEGRLVTASLDGALRLYNNRFLLIHKRDISADHKPYSAVFSPNGKRIAVGFLNRSSVAVFSGKGLDLLYFPDASAAIGDFRTVAWSADGHSLYGAGSHRNRHLRQIRWWKNEGKPSASGRGEFVDFPVASSTLSHILPLKGGGTLFCGAQPILGALDSQGFTLFRHKNPSLSFSSWKRDLLISADGSVVHFPYDDTGKNRGLFSVRHLSLTHVADATQLLPPLTQSSTLTVTGWNRQFGQLKLNGRRLVLKERERANALSFARDGRFFVVGTSHALRMFDQLGRSRWEIPVSSSVRGVTISLDGRVILAAHADGTLRWYQVVQGRLFLTLFPHRDRKRWIAWTPDRFFAASSGGDQLIGWHKNQGRHQAAKFIPANTFRKHYYRPDRIRQLFSGTTGGPS